MTIYIYIYIFPSRLPKHNISCSMFNARSVRNKADIIHQLIIDSKSSIVAITETWLTNNDSSIPSQLTPTNFDIIQAKRLSPSRGGGLAIIYSSEFKLLYHHPFQVLSLAKYLVVVSCYLIQLLFNLFLFIVHHHQYLTTFYLNLNPFLNQSRQII